MKQPGFQVVEGEKNFMVFLPLVWKLKQNNINHYKKYKHTHENSNS